MAPEKAFAVPPPSLTPAPPVYTFGQLWQVPLFFAGLLAVLGVWLTRPLWYDPETAQLRRELATARSQLDDPQAALNGLTLLLTDALDRIDRLPERTGEVQFLLGSTYLRLAEEMSSERVLEIWRTARSHLEEAQRCGVPEADQPRLVYRLAKAWYHTGGEPQRVIDYLTQSIDRAGDDRAEGYEMLTQCYLRLPVRDVRAALLANEKLLQLPTLDETRLMPARLLRGELLLDLGERAEARKVLARIGAGAPPAILSRARLLRARSYQEHEDWAEAAKLWEEILADRRQTPAEPARIRYWLGLCYRNLNRLADAARCWEPAVQPGGEEGQAASLRLANVRAQGGNHAGALQLYDRALSGVNKPGEYRNGLVSLVQACLLLASDCRNSKDAGNFEVAEKLAHLHAKLAPPGPAQALLGQVAEVWAGAQRGQAQQLKDGEAARQEEEAARIHFREAGAAYQAAAAAAAGQPEQADWLWHAGACYLQGQDFGQAVAVFGRFVKLQPPLPRLSEAWYRLGEAHQALHDGRAAEVSYLECIATNGLFRHRARYQLALAALGRANFVAAEEMLNHNLDQMRTEPDREAHEETLYALAEVLFARDNDYLAAKRWEEALALYPANPAASTARYRLAVSYRRLAERERRNLERAEILEPRYRTQFILWLERAAAHYEKLVKDVEARPAAHPLTKADAALLLQARFALAECRFDQGFYNQARALYSDLASQYHHQVEGLIALKQLYRCYVAPAAPENPKENVEKALATLKGLRLILQALDDAALQGGPQPQSRQAWERWLKEEEEKLKVLPFVNPQT